MLDFNHILSTPGYDFQQFVGGSGLIQWQTWRKPRGVKWVYLIGVGGGASGGCGINTGAGSGGGSGGGSGAQTTVLIPATFVPDILYIHCGVGAIGPTTSGAVAVQGIPTYVAIEPDTTLTANMTLLFANAGAAGTAAAAPTTGGTATTAAAAATIANMPLAGRGIYNSFNGQIGTAGGSNLTAGITYTLPTSGIMVTGGTGGGGSNGTTAQAGGAFTTSTGSLGQDFFPGLTGGIGAVSSTPATAGSSFISRNFLLNYGGTGGGGGTNTAGGFAGAGGNGAPGCGGGGSGGATSTNNTLKAGDGGPGFVYIISW
jgi:hypothetical protein